VNLGARGCVLFLVVGAGCRGARPVEPELRCLDREQVVITDDADIAALAGCIQLPRVLIRTAAPVDLSKLTALVAIEGDLVIGPTLGLTTITIPALQHVSGTVRISANGDLTGVFLPALRMTTALELVGNPSLVSLSAPALERVHGFLLEQLPALELVDTSRLDTVGDGPRVGGVPALTTWIGAPAHARGAVIDAPKLDPDTRAAIGREGPAPL
jgi:hypothetical protein